VIGVTGLATLSMTAIARVTGMSTTTAGKVRSGQRVPHPRHWEALGTLVGVEMPVHPDGGKTK
jgi:hypothetical protein